MAKTRIEQTFDCDEDTYWNRVFLDDDFNQKLYAGHLQFPRWTVDKSHDTGDALERTITIVPKTGEIPKPIKKLIGDNIGYREEGRFDKTKKRYSCRIIPNSMADKATVLGEMWIEPQGTGIRRIFELTVTVKVFGVGGMVEKRIIEDTRKGYDDSYPFVVEHLRSL